MRQACVCEWLILGESILLKFRSELSFWRVVPSIAGIILGHRGIQSSLRRPILHPALKRISISVSLPWSVSGVPHDILPVVALAVSMSPTSTLQHLSVEECNFEVPWTHLKPPFSSLALRCGPRLVEFTSSVSLSDAAINHLIQLPHLQTLRTEGPPPTYPASSLPRVFPPLTDFTLGEGAVPGWFSLFERLEGHISATQGVTPLSRVKESLKSEYPEYRRPPQSRHRSFLRLPGSNISEFGLP